MNDTGQRSMAGGIRQALILTVLMILSLSLYLGVLRWRGRAAVFVTEISLDRVFPFRPEWVWVYLMPYVVGPILVGMLAPATFAWFIRRGLLLVFISLAIFICFPTQIARPPATDRDGDFTTRFYRNMATIDEPPANAAPSLHVSLTCLLAWALVRDFPRWWPAVFVGAGLVWLATLLIRQHHLIDVGSGVLLASLLAIPWRKIIPSSS